MPLSQADIDEFTEIFKTFDRDNSGTINRRELQLCMTQCGFNVNKEGVQSLLHAQDTNGDGKLDLKEFIALAQSLEQ